MQLQPEIGLGCGQRVGFAERTSKKYELCDVRVLVSRCEVNETSLYSERVSELKRIN